MSYQKLYASFQDRNRAPSSKEVRSKILEITGIHIPVIWSGYLNPDQIRGTYVHPSNPNHALIAKLGKHALGPAVIVARDQDDLWKRFVTIKECMHVFDQDLQKVGTPDDFAALIEEFNVPQPQRSEGMDSEVDAFWMALGVICPEHMRQEFARKMTEQTITWDEIATALRLPMSVAAALFDPSYKQIISRLTRC